jgi:hypothetical protein
MANNRSRGSDEENDFSADGKSPMPTHQDRQNTGSPAAGMNGLPHVQRQPSDYYMNAMNGGMAAVPPHMRNEVQPSPRAQSPQQYPMPVNGAPQQRPPLTSNPSAGHALPQILEPQPSNGQQQAGSGNNSPHINQTMTNGWQSPHHNGMPNNQPTADYSYPDPNSGYQVNNVNAMHTYYQPNVSRPHSTGPIDYTSQMRGQELWAQHQQ